VTIQALRSGAVPGTLNVENQDPEINLNIIAETTLGLEARAGISNAFGFGGHSASLVITAG
jgi:3-oxoacyl-[acyl-carrier-protein] synthase II